MVRAPEVVFVGNSARIRWLRESYKLALWAGEDKGFPGTAIFPPQSGQPGLTIPSEDMSRYSKEGWSSIFSTGAILLQILSATRAEPKSVIEAPPLNPDSSARAPTHELASPLGSEREMNITLYTGSDTVCPQEDAALVRVNVAGPPIADLWMRMNFYDGDERVGTHKLPITTGTSWFCVDDQTGRDLDIAFNHGEGDLMGPTSEVNPIE